MSENFKERLNKVKAFVFDIDGVLTNGIVNIHSDNTTSRTIQTKDYYALEHAAKNGYTVAIISASRAESMKEILKRLGVQEIYLGSIDKEEIFKEFITVYSLEAEETLYMGDDIPDLLAMRRAGVPTCPYDAAREIREISVYVSPLKGGEGCARDVIEQVMRLHGKW